MPRELQAAVEWAEAEDEVHVVVVEGAGKGFCGGYDLAYFGAGRLDHPCQQEAQPWDPMVDYAFMKRTTERIMSLWRSSKPTIAKVHGHAVAGGSNIALCCDLLVMAEDARIGYMPTRVWGCPTTAMWAYRLGPARARQLMYTGDLIDGRTAAAWGLANAAVAPDQLDSATLQLALRIAGVPRGQLAMHKLVLNQVLLAMGLEQAQMSATVFDGISRHNPEGMWFRRHAQEHGFKAAVQWRDSGRPIPEGDEARALVRAIEARHEAADAVPPAASEVVEFWRAAGPARWFRKDAAFDETFRNRFLALHDAAARGELDAWAATADGALALLILLDQFPRNAFRGSARSYATDVQARRVADAAVAAGHDARFDVDLRAFFYLPYEHSESLADQDRAVGLMAVLSAETLRYAELHRDIIRQFGRFPHRNAALGRTTTEAEQRFLDAGGFAG